MAILERDIPAASALQKEWLHAIEELFADVEGWAKTWLTEQGWTPNIGWDVMRTAKEVRDDFSHEAYRFPVLEINAPPAELQRGREVKLVFEPFTLNAAAGTGRIDFYVWPAMYRVRMLWESAQKKWTIKTDSGVNWPLPWGEQTFTLLADGLLEA